MEVMMFHTEKNKKMKRLSIYSIALLTYLLSFSSAAFAQLDSRNRTTETIIADNLAQLPTQNPETYSQVIGELADTGSEGLLSIIQMLVPADKGKNATFEYAISGIVNYATAPENEKYREGVRKALITGLENCTDNPNKAFLMTELQQCATSADVSVFEKYLSDPYLSAFAERGLKVIPGIDDEVIRLMQQGSTSKEALANIAGFRKLNADAAEPILLSWVKGADEKTLSAIYPALAVCGTVKSLKVLKTAAQQAVYPSNAIDAYLTLLHRLSAAGRTKIAAREAQELWKKNEHTFIQDAALQILMKSDKAHIASYLLSALTSGDKDLRNAALSNASAYADPNIYEAVVSKFTALSTEAQMDVMNWLADHRVSSQIDAVVHAIGSPDNDLSKAAIRAAGIIGGQQALNALIGQLGGKNAPAASAALMAFNGNINDGVVSALNGHAATQVQALKLASARKMYRTYEKVVSLLNASDPSVKEAAYDALGGVAEPDHFSALCRLLEKGENVPKVQAAAMNAIKTLPGDEQCELIDRQLDKTSNPTFYYPLLGQAGNPAAIQQLLTAYRNGNHTDALNALLQVDNPEMIEVLYRLAKEADTPSKDGILNRYLTLVNASAANHDRKFGLYRQALELHPSLAVENKLINALGTTRTLPALMLISTYLDNRATAVQAAYAIKDILGKNTDLLGGSSVKQMLTKARQILRGEQDADAGYAVDEIDGLLAKVAPEGFEPVAVTNATGQKPFKSTKTYENVEFYIDWKSADAAVLAVRSMPAVSLSPSEVVFLHGEGKAAAIPGEWNTLYVKVLNDRLFVKSNGKTVVENAVLKNTPDTKPIRTEGLIEFATGKGGEAELRNLYIRELPATPVFTLSDEEKKAGYVVLFDGRSLENWQGNLTAYVPEDGNIYVSANYGGSGNLYTKKKYSDFIYRFEFCFAVEGVNNGIGIRTNIGSDAAYDGMEIQVLDHDAPIYKGLHDYQQHGAVYGIIVPKHVNFGPLNTWHTEEIRAIGDRITVIVDGETITDGNIREACQGHNVAPDGSSENPYTVDHKNHPGLFNKDGHISFCGHGAGVKFRHIRILDLSKKK